MVSIFTPTNDSKLNIGKTLSEEHKEKIRVSSQRRGISVETRKKMNESRKKKGWFSRGRNRQHIHTD